MLLSKSNFKNSKLNANVNNVKNNIEEKESKDVNNNINNIKKKNHHYVNSLKMINKDNALYHNKIFSRKNKSKNNKNIIQKFIGRNKAMVKKQIEKLNYLNSINNNSSNTNTINYYNFIYILKKPLFEKEVDYLKFKGLIY